MAVSFRPPVSLARSSNIRAVRATVDPDRSLLLRLASSLIARLVAEGSSCSALKLSKPSIVQAGSRPFNHWRTSGSERNPGATMA